MTEPNRAHAVLYHNPKCGTSRAVLAILLDSGHELKIVEYLKTPLTPKELADLAEKLGGASVLVRAKEPLAAELGLQTADNEKIFSAIAAHPILLNRPIVVTAKGATLCRPAELVHSLL